MTPLDEINIVRESTLETQKIIHELLEVTSMQQSSMKDLSEKAASKTPGEFKDTREKLKRQIQNEGRLTKRLESILERQSTLLKQNWKTDGSEMADDINELSVMVSSQNQTVKVLKTTLLSLEHRIEQLEKSV